MKPDRGCSITAGFVPPPARGTDLYLPTFTHRMSLKRGFLPALQSLQYQLPFGISMFRHSLWNAAGQDSQQSRLPPSGEEEEQHYSYKNIPFFPP